MTMLVGKLVPVYINAIIASSELISLVVLDKTSGFISS